jgi:hypothetical protein
LWEWKKCMPINEVLINISLLFENYSNTLQVCNYFFIASWVGVSPFYRGHFWPIVPAPDDRWVWLWSNWWNEDWQGKPKYSEKTCPSATLSTTNPTWPDPGSYPGRRDGKPATNGLGYGAARFVTKWHIVINLKSLTPYGTSTRPTFYYTVLNVYSCVSFTSTNEKRKYFLIKFTHSCW